MIAYTIRCAQNNLKHKQNAPKTPRAKRKTSELPKRGKVRGKSRKPLAKPNDEHAHPFERDRMKEKAAQTKSNYEAKAFILMSSLKLMGSHQTAKQGSLLFFFLRLFLIPCPSFAPSVRLSVHGWCLRSLPEQCLPTLFVQQWFFMTLCVCVCPHRKPLHLHLVMPVGRLLFSLSLSRSPFSVASTVYTFIS